MEEHSSAPTVRSRWLIISALLNLVLLVSLVVFAWPSLSRGVRSPAAAVSAAPASSQHDLRATERALRSAGFSSDEAKRAVYLIVADSGGGAVPYEYWKPASVRDAAERIAQYQRDEATRATLIRMYGEEGATDPAFAAAFRPYERELPMLDSEEQLRLQALRMDGLKASGGRVTAGPPRRGMVEAAFASDLRKDALLEYQLRESPLARALTSLPFDFTEQEFREAFRVLAAAKPERVMEAVGSLNEILRDPATFDALRSALGAGRYAEFAKVRDPRYMLLRRIGGMHGVSPDKVDQAYALMSNSGASAQTLEQKLSGLLGADATADVLRAYGSLQRSVSPMSPTFSGASIYRGQPAGPPGGAQD